MKKFGVWVTFKETAYVEVEAENEEEAEELGYDEIMNGNGEPYGSDEDYDIETEEIEDETKNNNN